MSRHLLPFGWGHPRRAITGIILIVALVTLAAPALAGGFAVVRLDEPPGEVLVATPWQFGFLVLQHDVTPNSDVTPVIRAVHKETGEEVTATGRQEGAVGHFVAEVTFPRAGEWKWSIEPLPFAGTSFETLTVLESLHDWAFQARLVTGSCAAPGDVAYSLGDVTPQPATVKSSQVPLAIGAAAIDTPLSELLASEHAVGIGVAQADGAMMACGNVAEAASAHGDDLVLGLLTQDERATSAENVGIAVLREEGERTAVDLYLLNPEQAGAINAATPDGPGETRTVEILDTWSFQPYSLEIPLGTTVTWVNNSDKAHTVTGEDLAFDDSGLIEPGDSFRQTFVEPGTYRYTCGPHPDMMGLIVVG